MNSQLDEDELEEYIGKITDRWSNIDTKTKIRNQPWQENTTTNFNKQDNKKTIVAADSRADNLTTNSNIKTRAVGGKQRSINGKSYNEQQETSNSAQRDNLNSFYYIRLAYSCCLHDQQNKESIMGDTQTLNQPAVQLKQLSTTFSEPFPFYPLYVKALPMMDLQKFNGDASNWAGSYNHFSFMIVDTHFRAGQKIVYLLRFVIAKLITSIKRSTCKNTCTKMQNTS